MDSRLTASLNLAAVKRFFRKMLRDEPLLALDRIGTDGVKTSPPAVAAASEEGLLRQDPIHRVTKDLQQGIESDHFRVKKNMSKIGGFRSFHTARRTIKGFEAMLWLRKGFGFLGDCTVGEQNGLLARCLDSTWLMKPENRQGPAFIAAPRCNCDRPRPNRFQDPPATRYRRLLVWPPPAPATARRAARR